MSDGKASPFAWAYWLAAFAIVVGKLAGVIDIPWAAATAPFWAPVLAIGALVIVGALAGRGRRGR